MDHFYCGFEPEIGPVLKLLAKSDHFYYLLLQIVGPFSKVLAQSDHFLR